MFDLSYMQLFFTIFGIGVLISLFWIVNFYISWLKAQNIAWKYKYDVKNVEELEAYFSRYYEILYHHNPFTLGSWFGFKHWFYPYKEETNKEPHENI